MQDKSLFFVSSIFAQRCYTIKTRAVTNIYLNKNHRQVNFISRDCPNFNAKKKQTQMSGCC